MRAVLDQVSWIAVGYAGLVVLVSVYAAYRWRERPPWLSSLAWMLEFLVGLRALLGLAALGSVKPDAMSTHLGYLIASVCVVPLVLRSLQDDVSVWSIGVIGVAALAVGVIGVRIVMTL